MVGLLFTDNLGRVIFASEGLLTIMGYAEAGVIIGEPMHRVLGLDLTTESQLLKDVSAAKQIDDQPLELFDKEKNIIKVRYSARATYNHEGLFIGADLTLRLLTNPVESTQTQYYDNRDQRMETYPRSLEAIIYLRTYFTAQVEALQGMLMQIGGPRFRDTLHRIVNETAQENAWLVYISPNQVKIEDSDTDISTQSTVYRALLAKARTYAVTILGPSLVEKKMRAVDARMDTKVIDLADRLSLRERIM